MQFGGDPMNSGKHEHDGVSPLTWHWELDPHGDGTHGLPTNMGTSAAKIKLFLYYYYINKWSVPKQTYK